MKHCALAGFETIVSIPIRLHDRLMGEVDLFFHAQCDVSDAERSLLEALTAHLAGAVFWRANCMIRSRSRWPF